MLDELLFDEFGIVLIPGGQQSRLWPPVIRLELDDKRNATFRIQQARLDHDFWLSVLGVLQFEICYSSGVRQGDSRQILFRITDHQP